MSTMDSLRIQARFVVADAVRVLHPGQIVVRHGRVVEISEGTRCTADIELEHAAILPGLVNPHTHLEFSDLDQPFPAGENFPAWIASVIGHRRAQAASLTERELLQARRAALSRGLAEAFFTGSAYIADIVSHPWSPADLPSSDTFDREVARLRAQNSTPTIEFTKPLADSVLDAFEQHLRTSMLPRVLAMPEVIGLTEDRFALTADWARALLDLHQPSATIEPHGFLDQLGISPHSPYSVPFAAASNLLSSLDAQPLVAMHVAESPDELEWLATRSGAFEQSFRRLNIPAPTHLPTILDSLKLLASAPKSLAIHGNYLSQAEIRELAKSQSTTTSTTAVYCPRTHSHFGHSPYPLDALCKAGISVAIGTDSRASSPNLNLWSDVVEARRNHSTLSPGDALRMVTTTAARALGVESRYGMIASGRTAFLNAVATDKEDTRENLLDRLTAHENPLMPLTCVPR